MNRWDYFLHSLYEMQAGRDRRKYGVRPHNQEVAPLTAEFLLDLAALYEVDVERDKEITDALNNK